MPHWWTQPLTFGEGITFALILAATLQAYARQLAKAEFRRAKTKLDLELQQLRQRRNLAEIATQQAEERAKGQARG